MLVLRHKKLLKLAIITTAFAILQSPAFANKFTQGQHQTAIVHALSKKAHRVSSGVAVSRCHVVSNEHVVRNSVKAYVILGGKRHDKTRVVAVDHKNDLSLLYIEGCPIKQPARISNIQPRYGEQLVSVYQKRSFPSRNRVVATVGKFKGYKRVITEEDRHMQSMVISDKRPRKGSSGGGVFSQHGLVSVIFGFVNTRYGAETYAVDHRALKSFLGKHGIR